MFFFDDSYDLLILQTTSLYCVLCLVDAHKGEIKPMFGRNYMEKKMSLYLLSIFIASDLESMFQMSCSHKFVNFVSI